MGNINDKSLFVIMKRPGRKKVTAKQILKNYKKHIVFGLLGFALIFLFVPWILEAIAIVVAWILGVAVGIGAIYLTILIVRKYPRQSFGYFLVWAVFFWVILHNAHQT